MELARLTATLFWLFQPPTSQTVNVVAITTVIVVLATFPGATLAARGEAQLRAERDRLLEGVSARRDASDAVGIA